MLKRSLSIIALSATLSIGGLLPVNADGIAGAYLAARSASIENDFSAAAQYFTRALIRDPNNVGLMEGAILSFVDMGNVKQAVPIARRLQASVPDSQMANMLLLANAVESDGYETAFDLLEQGETVGPLVDGLVKAWVQIGQGNMSDALASFDEISTGAGLQTFGLFHKSLALAMVGDMEGAEEILSGSTGVDLPATRRGTIARIEVLSQLERNDDALLMISGVFGDELDPGLRDLKTRLEAGEMLPFTIIRNAKDGIAEVFYSVATALNGEANDSYTLVYTRVAEHLRPDHVDSILLTAGLLEQLQRYELATDAYDRIPRSDPAFHAAELGRAEAMRRDGNTDGAIEVLQQLAESHSDQPDIHVALGDLMRRLDRFEESAASYDKAVALYGEPKPEHWVLYYTRGISFERIDNWEKAEADFRTALELSPNQPQVLNYLGYSFVEMGENLDEALAMIETAVAERPNDGYITDSLGWVLYRLGRYGEAVGHMERAAELEAVDPIVNDHLGDVYWAVGRKREAEFQWYRALSFEPEDEDAERIRRKLAVGLDAVLSDEGADPILSSNDN